MFLLSTLYFDILFPTKNCKHIYYNLIYNEISLKTFSTYSIESYNSTETCSEFFVCCRLDESRNFHLLFAFTYLSVKKLFFLLCYF